VFRQAIARGEVLLYRDSLAGVDSGAHAIRRRIRKK
jgi:hypothetical protein